jgi:hypothetical protein
MMGPVTPPTERDGHCGEPLETLTPTRRRQFPAHLQQQQHPPIYAHRGHPSPTLRPGGRRACARSGRVAGAVVEARDRLAADGAVVDTRLVQAAPVPDSVGMHGDVGALAFGLHRSAGPRRRSCVRSSYHGKSAGRGGCRRRTSPRDASGQEPSATARRHRSSRRRRREPPRSSPRKRTPRQMLARSRLMIITGCSLVG